MLCDNQEGWGERLRHRGYTHTHTMVDSHFYMAETNTTLLSNYPAIKRKNVFFLGNSLVQWLQLCIFTAKGMDLIPGQGTRNL